MKCPHCTRGVSGVVFLAVCTKCGGQGEAGTSGHVPESPLRPEDAMTDSTTSRSRTEPKIDGGATSGDGT